jgi:hypothetical protein
MKVQEVKYISDYIISIKFDDGVNGTIELNDLVQKGIFKVLQDKNQFAKVYTNGYSIAWSNELEIDATTIYAELMDNWERARQQESLKDIAPLV